MLGIVILAVVHSLGNGVLMGAGEGGEDQRTGIGLPFVDMHPGHPLIDLLNGGHIREIKPGIDAMAVHVHRQRNDIDVAGAFAVAEEGAFNPVGARQQPQFGVSHSGAAVVVRMQRNLYVSAAVEAVADILDLACIDMRKAHLDSRRQIDDDRAFSGGFPDIDDRIADVEGKLDLGAGEALRGVFEAEIAGSFLGKVPEHLRPLDRQRLDFCHRFFEDLLALGERSGVVKVNNRTLAALQSGKGLFNDMRAGLGQHLYRHIVRNAVLLDQGAQKLIFGV